jgi:uncharacterized protein
MILATSGLSLQSVTLAACVGVISGISSGLCGVSPGGAIVVFSTLFLGAEQHVAQGISLAAQTPPTGLSGIYRYRKEGAGCPIHWLLWLASGFLLGGVSGAFLASKASTSVLQWSYVGYLAALDVLLILRSSPERHSTIQPKSNRDESIPGAALLAIGLLAGLSSGYLGIGGGLAIVAGLSGGLGVPQHRAQMISLVLSIIPTTFPAAYIYWRAGRLAPWPILLAVVVGLWGGTDFGARLASHMKHTTLRVVLVLLVTAMAAYMVCKAVSTG